MVDRTSSRGSISRRAVARSGLTAVGAVLGLPLRAAWAEPDGLAASLIAGEPAADSILLQARVSPGLPPLGVYDAPTPGVAGSIRFELSRSPRFDQTMRTAWGRASPANDFIVKTRVGRLKAGATYYYRVEFRSGNGPARRLAEVGAFATLPSANDSARVSIAVISCMNYEKFFGIVQGGGGGAATGGAPWSKAAEGQVRARGYPAMDVILDKKARYLIATGDTVYYDPIAIGPPAAEAFRAKTIPQMRSSWHRQFAVPSLRQVLQSCGVFWMKDDHDFRYDDADNTGDTLPRPEAGRVVFLEQVPIPSDRPTYRTCRFGRHLQVWLIEGRDYRSANDAPDGPGKSLWGVEQRRWLEQTLVQSDADFKLIINPDPIIGPDDARKKDNQADEAGFHVEGEAFLHFLEETKLAGSTLILNGDRHWQYHSIHPTGVEEICCGTIHRQNSRPGVRPGEGTDPQGRLRQPYLSAIPEGGFLQVEVLPGADDRPATLVAQLWAETGELRHEVRRTGT